MPKELNIKTTFIEEQFSPDNMLDLSDYAIGTCLTFVRCTFREIDFDDNQIGFDLYDCLFTDCVLSVTMLSAMRSTFTSCFLDSCTEDYDMCDLNSCTFGHDHNSNWRRFNACNSYMTPGVTLEQIVPSDGAFIGWKKCYMYEYFEQQPVIVKLLIPASAKRLSTIHRKCRASCAKVLAFETLDGKKIDRPYVWAMRGYSFMYKLSEMVFPDRFDPNPFASCSHGINFFIRREEAVNFEF